MPKPTDIVIRQEHVDEVVRGLRAESAEMLKSENLAFGSLGEVLWAEVIFGDFRLNLVGRNRSENDFPSQEIKLSRRPGLLGEYLMANEESVLKRDAHFWTGGFVDCRDGERLATLVGRVARWNGWCFRQEVADAKMKLLYGVPTLCVPIGDLLPMNWLLAAWARWHWAGRPPSSVAGVLPASLAEVRRVCRPNGGDQDPLPFAA